MTDTLSGTVLTALMARKLKLLLEFRQLADQQWQWITCDEMAKLLNVLAAKQELLRELQTVERQLDPFRGQDPESRVWNSAEERARCRHLVEQCENVLAEILHWERQGERELLRRRDEAAARLQALERQSTACRAYLPAGNATVCGQQLDLASEG